jgi:hypothetical protein
MATRYQCSTASGERREPMLATGSQVRRWLLVEVHGAWGADAIHQSALGNFVPPVWKDELRQRHIRVVCIRSLLRPGEGEVRLYTCNAPRPGSGQPVLWQRDVAGLGDVAAVATALVDGDTPGEGWSRAEHPLILVCANGRHDQCCANRGRPVIRALRDSEWADRMWECSHIGGDRFAANLVLLPHSLYFGRVEAETAADLVALLDSGRIDLAHFRGRTSYTLTEQAVEHFVRQELGIDRIDGVAVGARGADGAFRVQLADGAVDVKVRRRLVTIAEPLTCKGSPNQLVPAYDLESITPSPPL